ncbi:MAG: redox-sensing transcriptional repressor Rex [Lentisphaeria bacterium]
MGRMKIQNSPTIRRMPSYLHKLFNMRLEGKTHVSTTELAKYMNIELIVVRKDIALTGIAGLRRVGYNINDLIDYIKSYLGWTKTFSACLIGAGALGTAILGYEDFVNYGLNIGSVFDCSDKKIGTSIHGREVYDIETIGQRFKHYHPDMAIICVSNTAAQAVTDKIIQLGIHYIWNFANVCLQVPPKVIVQREVLAGGLATLTVKMKHMDEHVEDKPIETKK